MDEQATTTNWIAPWFTIWIRPRATIRKIVETDPEHFVLGIAWVSGALAALNLEVGLNTGQMSSKLPNATNLTAWISTLGPVGLAAFAFSLGVFGVAMIYLLGMLYRWSGALLGGIAQTVEVRSALAWSQVPAIYVTTLGVLVVLLSPAAPSEEPAALPLFSWWTVLRGALGIWAFIISVKALGEVHGFSAWRGFGAMLIGIFVMVGVILGVLIAVLIGQALM